MDITELGRDFMPGCARVKPSGASAPDGGCGTRIGSGDGNPPALERGLLDGVADDSVPIAILKRRAQRRHLAVVDYRVEEVRDLVHEGVLPPDDVARRPPVGDERMRWL